MPKRPLSAYLTFSNVVREEIKEKNPKMSFSNVNKTLGKLWSELNDTDRKIYQDIAIIAKEKYKDDMEDYHKNKKY